MAQPTSTPRRIVFLGISTAGSAVRAVFPEWMDLLGEAAELETVDIPAGSPAGPYRELVARLRDDASVAGAVVTAHKRALHTHAADLLAGVDDPARRLREVSVLYRRDGELCGTAIEVASVGTTLVQLGGGTALTSADADTAVYGAGGTTVALLACLADASWPAAARPRRVHLVDTSPERLREAAELGVGLSLEQHVSGGHASLADLAPLSDGSLIVNATGLGKDRPGSPVALPARWPRRARVWDLNYRGELAMLEDARAAAPELGVSAYDGWLLFVNGWAEALQQIFGRAIGNDERAAMEQLASRVRAG